MKIDIFIFVITSSSINNSKFVLYGFESLRNDGKQNAPFANASQNDLAEIG